MALTLSSAILQGVIRNDLADPGIIGINARADIALAASALSATGGIAFIGLIAHISLRL